MRVFLMYPDRDFDPEQELPPNEAALRQDLELNTLFEAMALGDEFLFEVAKQAVLSSLDALDTICYRQEILRDCLKYPDVIRQIYHIPLQFTDQKRRHWWGIWAHHSSPNAILSSARELLEMSVDFSGY